MVRSDFEDGLGAVLSPGAPEGGSFVGSTGIYVGGTSANVTMEGKKGVAGCVCVCVCVCVWRREREREGERERERMRRNCGCKSEGQLDFIDFKYLSGKRELDRRMDREKNEDVRTYGKNSRLIYTHEYREWQINVKI